MHQQTYKNALCIFNDTEFAMNTFARGRGNSRIRSYHFLGFDRNGFDFPRSVGIATGIRYRGYRDLEEGMISISHCFNVLDKLLKQYNYDEIYFSIGKDGLFACDEFYVNYAVKIYITGRILQLVQRPHLTQYLSFSSWP